MRSVILATLVVLSGCLGPVGGPMKPHQLEAERAVWSDVLHGDWAEPPAVTWHEGETCPGLAGVWFIEGGECFGSRYHEGRGADVAWRGSFSASEYARVLVTHLKALETIASQTPLALTAADLEKVDTANRALVAAGL